MKNSHKCTALAISCIDYRFVGKVRQYLIDQGLKDNYDLITVPGASLKLADVADSISTSMRLHDPDEVYIFDHEDCGAYGVNNSKSEHIKNLNHAKERILKNNPEKLVSTYFTDFNFVEEIN
ncbi:MAG: hypothetical protein A2Z11_03190 [Candidatus Woykebacteria bacterium RBG_16_43_9]|uniref:Carbonic anhydrase n=1 Tax=Candidatus Woykebacteria bacterium RBG_16_43_9 TaxID=1802596 RepID=A0A1G1WHE9_9BACT|nr:MAG: hypothetical protein A2Z11_03190 [Candidatus Woykebacteria bacterium RBG_16_43_9]